MSATATRPIPNVPGLPIIGNLRPLVRDAMGFLVDSYHAHGAVYRMRVPGREIVILAGLDANLFMIQHGAELFRLKPIYGKLVEETASDLYLPALDEPEYSYYRRMIKPKLSRDALAAHLPDAVSFIETTARAWQPGQSINVLDTMTRLCLEIVSRSTEGTPVGAMLSAITLFTNRLIGSGVAFQPAFLLKLPDYQRAKRQFEAYLAQIVDEHRARGAAEDGDFVDLLLGARTSDGKPLTGHALLAYVHLPFVNGVAYAPRLAGYLLYELLRDPELLAHVQAEVDAAFAEGVPTMGALRGMRWLYGACIEVLRLYPVAGALPRYVAETFDFGGCTIPKGQLIFLASGVAHFLPELYADPYRFDPRRAFERGEHHTQGAFAPYGLGERTCLSAGMGEALIMLVAATVLHTVRLALPTPNYKLKTEVAPIPGPARSFTLRVVERRNVQ
jgi:cytochrome P450